MLSVALETSRKQAASLESGSYPVRGSDRVTGEKKKKNELLCLLIWVVFHRDKMQAERTTFIAF